MGWTHTHPSTNCYKNHGCRCSGCTALNTEASRQTRERRKMRARGITPPPRRTPKSKNPLAQTRKMPLSEEEVTRLRRQVGLA